MHFVYNHWNFQKQKKLPTQEREIVISESKERTQNMTFKPQTSFCNLKAHLNEDLSVIISTDSSATPLH